MLLARYAQRASINLSELVQMLSIVLKGHATELCTLQLNPQRLTRNRKEVQRESWVQAMLNVESLRRHIEREGDQGLISSPGLFGVVQRSLQKFITKAMPLLAGGHEQVR